MNAVHAIKRTVDLPRENLVGRVWCTTVEQTGPGGGELYRCVILIDQLKRA